MQNKFAALLVAISLIAMGACKSGNQEETPQNAAATSPAPSGGTSSQPAAPPAPQIETVTVPAGTTLAVRLGTEINTGMTQPGSSFQGTLADALIAHGVEVAPRGSSVEGQVTNVVSSGRLNRPAEVSLVLTSIRPQGGSRVQISTRTWAEKGKSHKKRDAIAIGGGAGVGALIGALAGHGKGAAIGAAIGAGAGTAGAAMTGKKEIVLPVETRLTFRLSAPVNFEISR